MIRLLTKQSIKKTMTKYNKEQVKMLSQIITNKIYEAKRKINRSKLEKETINELLNKKNVKKALNQMQSIMTKAQEQINKINEWLEKTHQLKAYKDYGEKNYVFKLQNIGDIVNKKQQELDSKLDDAKNELLLELIATDTDTKDIVKKLEEIIKNMVA
jgi:hypothetical protein